MHRGAKSLLQFGADVGWNFQTQVGDLGYNSQSAGFGDPAPQFVGGTDTKVRPTNVNRLSDSDRTEPASRSAAGVAREFHWRRHLLHHVGLEVQAE